MNSLINNINNIAPFKNIKYIYPFIKKYKYNDWENYKLKTNYYKKNTIYQNKYFEIVVISWAKNTITPIHSHPENGCILKVLEGKLIENFYDNEIIITQLNKDNISCRNGGEIHTITALEDSYSLHIYSPPGFYD